MNIKYLKYVLLCLSLISSQSISLANANEECVNFGIVTVESQDPSGVKITKIVTECGAYNLGLHEGDIILSINDNLPAVDNVSNLLAAVSSGVTYIINVVDVNGTHQTISNIKSEQIAPDRVSVSQTLLSSEELIDSSEGIVSEPAEITADLHQSEEPIYAQRDEVGYDSIKWIKWLVFFVFLSLTLTPFLIIFASNNRNVAFYLGSAAILGAAHAEGNVVKGAVENVQLSIFLYFILLLLGPLGTIYCIYRPLFAFVSDADKTYCCAMTWLGSTHGTKQSISPDGHWFAEIRQTQNNFLGLGDKEVEESHVLSVMNLETGRHVKWPKTGQKLIGVNVDSSDVRKIQVSDGIFIQPVDELTNEEPWYRLRFADDFIRPLNPDRVVHPPVRFTLLSAEPQYKQVTLQNVLNGDIVTIQSNLGFNANYLSYDGRVLALVRANVGEKSTDGLVRQIANLLGNYLFEGWTIEFWDVANNKKIGNYSGHGINSYAWNLSDNLSQFLGTLKFLESSQDGRLWYMIKNDGYIHVFDMRNKILALAN